MLPIFALPPSPNLLTPHKVDRNEGHVIQVQLVAERGVGTRPKSSQSESLPNVFQTEDETQLLPILRSEAIEGDSLGRQVTISRH